MGRTKSVVSCLVAFLITTVVCGTAQAMSAAASPQGTVSVLNVDPRLSAGITLSAKSATLVDCFKELRRQTGVRLIVDKDIRYRRVHVFVNKFPLRNLMLGLRDVLGLSWQCVRPLHGSSATPGYRLFKTGQQRALEERLIKDSTSFEESVDKAKRDGLLQAIRGALNAPTAATNPIVGLLSTMSPEQLDRIAASSAEDVGVHSASDSREYYRHLFYAVPFMSLPENIRANVTRLYGDGNDIGELAHSSVGLVAAEGCIRLGVVPPDGADLWLAPAEAVSRRGIPGIDINGGMDAETNHAETKGVTVSLDSAPANPGTQDVRIGRNVNRRNLGDVLEAIAAAVRLPVVSDDYMRSRDTVFYGVLTDRPAYGLKEAMEQVARAYGHHVRFAYGALCLSTATLGADMRCEPPGTLVERLLELTVARQFPTLEDYVALARLSLEQLTTLQIHQTAAVGQFRAIEAALRMRDVLQFYGLLNARQRRNAATGRVSRADLSGELRRAFETLGHVGMPGGPVKLDASGPPGFWLRLGPSKSDLHTVTFFVVPTGTGAEVRAYRLNARVL